ncbi:MAG: HlyD family efflux transporter periplasmic adaptor subunit [Planctomycetaceae bacterium]
MSNVDLRELAVDRTSVQPAKARRSLLTRYVLPVVLLLGFMALVGWSARDYLFPPKSVTVIPVYSTTSEIRQEGAVLFQAAGWIEPRPTPVRVAALAPGVVETLLVVEDQELAKGDPIAELVKDDAKLMHGRAMADLSLREAELAEAKAEVTATTTRLEQPVHLQAPLADASAALAKIETELQNLPYQITSAEADYAALETDYQGKLSARGVIAGTKIDIAKNKAAAAKAKVSELQSRKQTLVKERQALTERRDALETQLKLLADEKNARDSALARVQQCVARRKQAEVAVAEAQLQLDRMTIRAPVDGRVYHLLGHPGSRIGGGMSQMAGHDGSTIVTMYQPSMLQVRVDVRFEDLPKVSLKQPVLIKNASSPDEVVGEVLFISSEADIQKNTLQVKVGISNPPKLFRPEMLVDVTFREPKNTHQHNEMTSELKMYVPDSLVMRNDAGASIWVADQSAGAAVKATIEVGDRKSNSMVEVISGLTVASRLIVGGRDQLKPGDRIRITSEEPPVSSN